MHVRKTHAALQELLLRRRSQQQVVLLWAQPVSCHHLHQPTNLPPVSRVVIIPAFTSDQWSSHFDAGRSGEGQRAAGPFESSDSLIGSPSSEDASIRSCISSAVSSSPSIDAG